MKLSSNQVASRVIETLIPYSDETIFNSFLQEFSKNFRPICSDPFASHVLQKLIEISFIRGVSQSQPNKLNNKKPKFDCLGECEFNLSTTFSSKHILQCQEFVIKASNFLLNNLEDFVYDTYANHLIRSCLNNLSGVVVKKTHKFDKSRSNEVVRTLDVPDEWKSIVVEYADRLYYWPQLGEFPFEEFTSIILQTLLHALKRCNKAACDSFAKKIFKSLNITENGIDVNEDDKDSKFYLPRIFSTESSSRFVEVLLQVANNKLMLKILNTFFLTKLKVISLARSANFAVQKLLENIQEVTTFELVFNELSPHLENILKVGHTGVVLSLAEVCLRLKSKQAAFIKALQTSLHCLEPKERSDLFPLLVLKLKPYEYYIEDKSNFIHIHGSLILQKMLHFNKPIVIINSFINNKNDVLAAIFSTPAGSHVADAFVQSPTVGEKSREKMIRYMQGTYFDLVMSRHGSRVFEALFNAAGDKQKEYLMKELAEKSGLLLSSQTGKIIASKYQLHSFTLCPARWRAEFNSKNKVKSLFKDIVN